MRELKKQGGGFLLEDLQPSEIFTPEDFTEEQRMFGQTAEEFMDREVLPNAEKIEQQDFHILKTLMKKAGDLGLLSVDIPEAYGGLGLDKVSSMIIAEKLAKQGSFSVTWGAHTGIGTLPIVFFGTEDQRQRYLPGLASGDLIGAYALTEPGAGSDAMNIQTKAVPTPDGSSFVLTGNKQFITNAGIADLFIVFAKVEGEHFTAFIVERDTPGLSIGPEEHKLGIKGSSTCSVTFDGVKVSQDQVLGEIGKGHRIAFGILNIGRYKLGVGAIGASKEALKIATQYAKERVQFGKPIAEFGLIQEKLAWMALRTFVTESMAYRLAGLFDEILQPLNPQDPSYPQQIWKGIAEYAVECSILKVYGSETLDFVADETVQIFGGYGYTSEYPAEQIYRDSRINRIFEGTNEINRLLIPGMLMRWALKGKLPLIPKAAATLKESLTLMPSRLSRPEGPLGEEIHMLSMAKRLTLVLSAVAANRFKEQLREEQEVLAALANMVMEVYAFESALLRALKTKSPLMEDAVRLYAPAALRSMEEQAYHVLPYLAAGDELRTLLSTVRKLAKLSVLPDRIQLQRSLAKKVIEKGGYPFGT